MSEHDSGQLGEGGWTPETLLAHFTSLTFALDAKIDALAQADPTANVVQLVKGEVGRLNDLRDAESRRVDEQAALRAVYDERLRDAEAKRIDAIRAVDVNAVAVASQRAADQATVLANQVVQSAEALRTLVASTAATVATSQQQLATTLSARLTTLEQGSYQAQGKSTYADPMQAEMVAEMKAMRSALATGSGKSAGMDKSWAILLGAVGFIATILGIAGILYAVLKP